MKLIIRYLKRHWALFLVCVILSFTFAIGELGIPTIFGRMIDEGIQKEASQVILKGFWLILLAAFTATIGMSTLSFCVAKLSTTAVYEIREDLFSHIMEFSVPEVEKFSIASLITRTSSDAFQILQFINTLLKSALRAPIMLVVSIVLIVRTSLSLSWIILGTIPIIIIGAILIFKAAGPLSEAQQKSTDSINRILRENLSGIRVVRSFNRQKTEEARFDKENRQYQTVSSRLFKLMSVSEPLFFILMNFASVLIYYVASLMISKNLLQIGQLIVFTEYLFHCMMSVLVVCMVFMMYPRAAISAKRIDAVLNTKPSILSTGSEGLKDVESLEFDHVSFAYPDSENHSLNDISFKIKKGQKLAIVGATGSGKSTLIRLLCRFYDPTGGTIKINGRPLEEYDLYSLRNQIALISQKAHLFSGTIEENLRFSNQKADKKTIERAIEIAQAKEFIQERKAGLQDAVSEEGTNLSGGQKQRISIARALCSEASLLIFDDSFSALDLKTDAKLRKALQPVFENSLAIIVAQRISTILDADLILLLDQGKLVAAGNHQELYKTSPLYQEIVLSQMNEEEALRYA